MFRSHLLDQDPDPGPGHHQTRVGQGLGRSGTTPRVPRVSAMVTVSAVTCPAPARVTSPVETTLRENTARDARMVSLVILSMEDSAPGIIVQFLPSLTQLLQLQRLVFIMNH